MTCEQIVRRINSLKHQIELMQDRLDELKKQPRTHDLIDEIQSLEDEIIDMKKDLMRLNTLFKENCQK